MISVTLVAVLMAAHFVGDFVAQSDWMAQNKSKSNRALGLHVATYSMVMLVILAPSASLMGVAGTALLLFLAVNAAAHFATDWVTSRWTSYLHKMERRHDFFTVIGLDQLVHGLTLLVTAWLWLTPGGAQ